MKSIIEDFSHISSRLTEIEQEKHTAIMTAPVENSAEQSLEQIYALYGHISLTPGTTDSGDTAPCEYVGYSCAPRFDNAMNFRDADGNPVDVRFYRGTRWPINTNGKTIAEWSANVLRFKDWADYPGTDS